MAFASMLCEGAAADWSAVYLRNSLSAAAVVASLGYAFFTAAMVLAGWRRCADRPPRHRPGVSALCVVATVGFAAGLRSGNAVVALIGLATLGGGVATVVPTVFSAAGGLTGITPSSGIAAVSACGWAGFVCGPPLIGQLASATLTAVALAVVPVLTAFIAIAMALLLPPLSRFAVLRTRPHRRTKTPRSQYRGAAWCPGGRPQSATRRVRVARSRISRGQSHDRAMAVHSSYYLPVVDVPLQRLLEQTRDVRANRKWLAMVPLFIVSALVVRSVIFGIVMGIDFP